VEGDAGGAVGGSFDVDGVPARCDGCGRDALAAGMTRTGWTVRPEPGIFAGIYCARCAATLRLLGSAVECSQCGRAVSEARAEQAGWRYYADPLGGLQPLCPACGPGFEQPA